MIYKSFLEEKGALNYGRIPIDQNRKKKNLQEIKDNKIELGLLFFSNFMT